MNSEAFKKLVEEAIDAIPERFLERLDNVAFLVKDRPTDEQISKNGARKNDLLLGLYEGIPLTERGENYGFALPDRITIFKDAIERVAGSEKEAREIVFDTVWHEVAHYFGLDEEEVREREERRGGKDRPVRQRRKRKKKTEA